MTCCCLSSQNPDPWPNIPTVEGDSLVHWESVRIPSARESSSLNRSRQIITASEHVFFTCIARLEKVLERVESGELSLDLTRAIQHLKSDNNTFLTLVKNKATQHIQELNSVTASYIQRALDDCVLASIETLYSKAILLQAEILLKAHPEQLTFKKSPLYWFNRHFFETQPIPTEARVNPVLLSDAIQAYFDSTKTNLNMASQGRKAWLDNLPNGVEIRRARSTDTDTDLTDERINIQNTPQHMTVTDPLLQIDEPIQIIYHEALATIEPSHAPEPLLLPENHPTSKAQNILLKLQRHKNNAHLAYTVAVNRVTQVESQLNQRAIAQVGIEG